MHINEFGKAMELRRDEIFIGKTPDWEKKYVALILSGDIKLKFFNKATKTKSDEIDYKAFASDGRIFCHFKHYGQFIYNRALTKDVYCEFFSAREWHEYIKHHNKHKPLIHINECIQFIKEQYFEYFPALTNPKNHIIDTTSMVEKKYVTGKFRYTKNQFNMNQRKFYYLSEIIQNPIMAYFILPSDWYDIEFTKQMLDTLFHSITSNYTINPKNLIPELVWQQEEIASFIMNRCPDYFEYLPDQWRNNTKFVLKSAKSNKHFFEKYFRQSNYALSFMSEEAKSDELCKMAVQRSIHNLPYCNNKILSDRDYILSLARAHVSNKDRRNSFFNLDLHCLAPELKDDAGFVQAYLSIVATYCKERFEHVTVYLNERMSKPGNTERFEHVTVYGTDLSWLSDRLKDDETLCRTLLTLGYSIKAFSRRLRSNKSILLVAMPQDFKFFTTAIRSNKYLIKDFLHKNQYRILSNEGDIEFDSTYIYRKLAPAMYHDTAFLVSLFTEHSVGIYDPDSLMDLYRVGYAPDDFEIPMDFILRTKRIKGTIFNTMNHELLKSMTLGDLKKLAFTQKLSDELLDSMPDDEQEEDLPLSKI